MSIFRNCTHQRARDNEIQLCVDGHAGHRIVMAIENSEWLWWVAILGVQLCDGLQMGLSCQGVHWNVVGWAAALLIALYAPHNASAIAGAGDQIRATVIQRQAGDYVQMAGDRSQGLALV